jgi:hypothetical protein
MRLKQALRLLRNFERERRRHRSGRSRRDAQSSNSDWYTVAQGVRVVTNADLILRLCRKQVRKAVLSA